MVFFNLILPLLCDLRVSEAEKKKKNFSQMLVWFMFEKVRKFYIGNCGTAGKG